ncbi:uncharacterized protein LOC131234644 [Magnolia sinica]|uniref:uncharacterized protein LOC131234644 n=1 Tax=Magnolia sinica TaxID=86752 RepID=UPI002659BC5B|nr:uncharacterized protein LOC131234644 [Magnolia sinica]
MEKSEAELWIFVDKLWQNVEERDEMIRFMSGRRMMRRISLQAKESLSGSDQLKRSPASLPELDPPKKPPESPNTTVLRKPLSPATYKDYFATLLYSEDYHLEGFLDDQYTQLQQLQDESNPDFVFEVVSLFFDDSEKLLDDLRRALDQHPVDFKKVDAHVHQLKGRSSRYFTPSKYPIHHSFVSISLQETQFPNSMTNLL